MKKTLATEILEHMVFCGTSMMISAIFVPYGQGLGQSLRRAERLAEKCQHEFSANSKETVSTVLSRLGRRGLVVRRGSKKKAVWSITKAGKVHFQKKNGHLLPPEDGKSRLVIFDIPERERRKRNWLRTRLLACNYSPVQKSVWVGNRPLPLDLLRELKDLSLTPYVQVIGLEDHQQTIR